MLQKKSVLTCIQGCSFGLGAAGFTLLSALWVLPRDVVQITYAAAPAFLGEIIRGRQNLTAVCIVGGIRSFIFPKVHQSIYLKVVSRVQPARVFMVLSRTRSADEIGGGNRVQTKDNSYSMQQLQEVIQLFSPVHIEVHRTSNCKAARETDANVSCCDEHQVNDFMQMHWIAHCFKKADHYEIEHQVNFDIFVRVRPDTYFYDAVPPRHILLGNVITVQVKDSDVRLSDWFFALARKGRAWVDDAYDELLNHCDAKTSCLESFDRLSRKQQAKCQRADEAFSPPEYSWWYAQRPLGTFITARGRSFQYRAVNMNLVIVRSQHAADCYRLITERHKHCYNQTLRGWH